jgi:biopolymer transport protein TolR
VPAVHARTGARRRTINEINMVPFIDVMLVLLIIFMVSAPLITTGVVDLPSVGKTRVAPQRVIEVRVQSDGSVRLSVDGKETERIPVERVAERVRTAQQGVQSSAVVVAGDKAARYEAVAKVLDALNRAEVGRVGLLVKNSGS